MVISILLISFTEADTKLYKRDDLQSRRFIFFIELIIALSPLIATAICSEESPERMFFTCIGTLNALNVLYFKGIILLQPQIQEWQKKQIYMQKLLLRRPWETYLHHVCVICLQEQAMGPAVVTACQHVMHCKCLDEWLADKNICPYCKTVLVPEKKVVDSLMHDIMDSRVVRSDVAGGGGGKNKRMDERKILKDTYNEIIQFDQKTSMFDFTDL